MVKRLCEDGGGSERDDEVGGGKVRGTTWVGEVEVWRWKDLWMC